MRRLAGRRLRRRRAGAGQGTLIISASRERQAELGILGGASEGNRTLMTSLEGSD
jgi:hypothetical protein